MRGGARVNSGPAPDPNALRRDRAKDKDGWTSLPAEGRQGGAPSWPLAPESAEAVAAREDEVWRAVWSTPQSVAWERNGWLHDVAIYVRFLVIAERGDLKAASEARQWSDRLGLNPAAMLRNRWRVVADEVSPRRAEMAPREANSARDRLKAISGGER